MSNKRAENMDAKTLQDIFIKILRSELNETELDNAVKDQLTPDVLSALYSLSKRHDLAHIVANSLYKNGFAGDDEIFSKFSQENIKSVYRCIQMNYALKEICNTFNDEHIPYIPLKGSVIRPHYPEESMRTSCDIDILIKEENLDAAINALIQKGFKCGEKNYHDVSLYSPNKIHLELHFNIQENIDTLDVVLKDAWKYATLKHNSCYEFTKEFFLFHAFAHMSYHFLSGGCGIRPLMDIWVMEHKMGISYHQARELLEKAGIYVFATEISNLVDVCFSDKPQDAFSDTLLSYIFDGGVYGSSQNKIAVKKENTKSTFRYSMQRLFMSYRDMTVIFPILKKLPFLLPFCWIIRIFKMIFSGKMRTSIAEIKTANRVSDKEIENIKKMKDKLGL